MGRFPVIIILALTLPACVAKHAPVITEAEPPPSAAARADAPSTRHQAAAIALSMVGKPYRFGGNGPRGFDCSGLVQYAYRHAGVPLPRTTNAQRKAVRRVDAQRLQIGDLLFFDTSWKSGHVGIYVGDGRFVHAPSSGKRVAVAYLDRGYFATRLALAGRPGL